MAKILLLSPPYIDLYGSLRKAAGRYFPLGIGYIASYLRKYGNHTVRMYEPEAQKLSYDDIAGIVREYSPDIVGITSSTPNFSRAIDLAKICRTNSKAKIVLGGVHVSALPEFVMDEYSTVIDNVVVGEGEETILQLVNAYQNNESMGSVPGVVYQDHNSVRRNTVRPFIEDLDSIPFPARDLIPQDLFAPNMHNARYRKCFAILTSRGCPFQCSFCAARIVSGRKYRMHSAEYVLEEMQMLKKDYGARQLIITDDTLTCNRERLEQICKGMIDRKMNLAWFCFSQVTTVDKELLSLMKKAGCYSIGFGLESSSEETLKRLGKSIRPAQAKETIKVANKIGIKTQAFYILGLPGENKEQMKDTIRFSKEVNARLAFYNMLVPYPGTKEFDLFYASASLKDINWEKFVAIGEDCVVTNSGVPAKQVEQLIADANLQYYLHPARLFNLLLHIRSSYELSNYLHGGISLFRQILRWSGTTAHDDRSKV